MKTGLLILSVYISLAAYSQGEITGGGKGWWIGLRASLNEMRVTDSKFSVVPYDGWLPGYMLLLEKRSAKTWQQLKLNYAQGRLDFPSNAAFLSDYYTSIDYTRLYTLNPEARNSFSYRAGGTFSFFCQQRQYNDFVNSDISYEAVSSLAATVDLSYHGGKKKAAGLSFSNSISVPFVSLLQQPVFGGDGSTEQVKQKGFDAGSFLKGSGVQGVSSFFRVVNRLRVMKKINGRQELSAVYDWDFYRIATRRPVKVARHEIGLSYSYQF